jgi:hypothetical protein
MNRWGTQKPVRFDEKELKTDLGHDNFIFVGSSCDMWAMDIPDSWIERILNKCSEHDNKYLFQSKNPARFLEWRNSIPKNTVLCTTIETNRWYPEIMRNSPKPANRAEAMGQIQGFDRYVTIEPVIDFDLLPMVDLIRQSEPIQVNIGADSGNNHLPEPSAEKIIVLINELNMFTKVVSKRNLERILGKEAKRNEH